MKFKLKIAVPQDLNWSVFAFDENDHDDLLSHDIFSGGMIGEYGTPELEPGIYSVDLSFDDGWLYVWEDVKQLVSLEEL